LEHLMTGTGFNTRMVRDLAKILKDNDLTEIEVDHEGTRVIVSRVITAAPVAATPVMAAPVATVTQAPAALPVAPAAATPAAPRGPEAGTVPSPMVGTLYQQAEPGSPAFIKVGDTVTEGQQLFIIEAMKTMNPVTAPHAGTVKAILVQDAQPVEFGEALCVIS
jgi:acetyl-CoA carboxylase biotin carboxyl carrier protein